MATEVLQPQSITVDGWTCWDYVDPQTDGMGNIWVWEKISGWFGGLDVRANPIDRPMLDGAYDGPAMFSGREVEVSGTLVAPDRATLQHGLDELARVLAGPKRVDQMVVNEAQRNVARTSDVRLGGPTLITRTGPYTAEWSIKLFAADPLRYGMDSNSLIIYPYSQGIGRVYDLVPNRVYGSMGSSGRGRINNLGNATTPLEIKFDGPTTNPQLRISGTDEFAKVLMTVQTGEQLVLNSYTRTVMWYAAGAPGVSRRQKLTADSTWLWAAPGPVDLFYSNEGGNGPCTVRWRDAWT
jgi:hypothetical protein